MSEQAKRIRTLRDDLKALTEPNQPLQVPVTETEFLGNVPHAQDAATRALLAVADIGAGGRPEVLARPAAEAAREKQLADLEAGDFGDPSTTERLVKEALRRERQDLAGQAAADMRLAAEAQVEKARTALTSGVPAMEVAAVVASAFTSLVEAHTYEQAAAHERTREHTRTYEGESHDEA